MLRDAHNRIIRDLRVSLTDRCNFRCFYCLPNGEPTMARKDTILTFEEIVEICEIFVSLGIEKIRLTGGEPLLRRDVEKLVGKIAKLKNPDFKFQISDSKFQIPDSQKQSSLNSAISNFKLNTEVLNSNPKSQIPNPKLLDLALTTNGFSLKERAVNLKNLGLDRVTISLDSLDRANFLDITGVDKLAEVLEAIEAAKRAGFAPIKINSVIVRGRNDHEIVDLAQFAREMEISMRYIEFMPLDSGHEWKREQVVSGREIFEQINARFPLELKEKSRGAETAWKYSFKDGANGEIGIIAPVTEMFCGACSRIRLTADGQIRTCLFSTDEHNLRDVLRSGASRAEIIEFIQAVVLKKEASHSINKQDFAPASRSMSFIGG